jgi:ribosome maturation factor RimP
MPKTLVDAVRLEEVIAPLCRAQGVELVDVRHQREPGGAVLRVLIELPDAETLPQGVGVTLEDCTRVSRALSAVLDADETLVPGAYRLEVGSAGIERPLVKPRDFERFAGREAFVSLASPVEGRRNYSGILAGVQADEVLLSDPKGEQIALPFGAIAKAHLVFRF